MIYLTLLASIILLSLAGIHIYWGFNGLWPGKSTEDLIKKVLGRGNVFPSLWLCLLVALVFLAMALLPLLVFDIIYIPVLFDHSQELLMLTSIIFGIRGFGFLIPSLFKSASAEFKRLNLFVYSPLCIFISFLLIIINIEYFLLDSISCEPENTQNNSDVILYFSADGKDKVDFNYISKLRLDHVLKIYQDEQFVFINSHGGGSKNSIQATINYLVDNGINKSKIIFEERSTNTWENIKYALPLIKDKQFKSIKFVSSPYHMDRILRYYQKQNKKMKYDFDISWESYNHLKDNIHPTYKSDQILHEALGGIRDVVFYGHSFTSGLCQ